MNFKDDGRTKEAGRKSAHGCRHRRFFAVIATTVVASVFLHGTTAAWGARRYGNWFQAHKERHNAMAEAVPVTAQRVRWQRNARHAGTGRPS